MKREILKERFITAVLEMYNSAECITGEKMHFDNFDELCQCCKVDRRGQKKIPYDSFFLDRTKQQEIISKATKGCRYNYMWPRKIKIGGDKKFDAYLKELEEYENNKKNLTPWFRKKEKMKIVEKYNLQYRSREAEGLSFEIWNISPTCNREYFERIKEIYNNHLKGIEPEERYLEDIVATDYFLETYRNNHVESK